MEIDLIPRAIEDKARVNDARTLLSPNTRGVRSVVLVSPRAQTGKQSGEHEARGTPLS